jgi:hypothetical protein
VAKPFTEYTFDDATELFGQKVVTSGGRTFTTGQDLRRSPSAIAASRFFEGDHWQETAGFIGQLPPASLPGAAQIKEDIRKAFVSENVIQEIIETHVGGILGREPLWSFLKGPDDPEAAVGELLTDWWNERKALRDLQRSAEMLILEGIAVKRLFFPKGRIPATGELSASDLTGALDYIYFETLTSDVAGVFTDPDTQFQIGIYLFEEKDAEGNVEDNCAELSYLNEEGETVCRVVKDRGAPEEFGPYRLGGRLLLHEMKRRPLITEQVQSTQRALNLAHTMMMRNVNMAGARERTVINAQPPKKPKRIQDSSNPAAVKEVLEPGTYETGGGAVMFLMGYPVRNERGDIVGYTNPNVSISDPAPVDVFVKTRDHYYAAMLSQCHQRHVLITGDATSSGRSREQARAEFERSLKETKTVVDAAGRWELETVLRLAAQLSNSTDKYLALRADFNCLIDSGDVDPEKARLVLDLRKPGGPSNMPLISDETARNWINIDDAAAELARIEEEAPAEPIEPVTDLTATEDDEQRLPAN